MMALATADLFALAAAILVMAGTGILLVRAERRRRLLARFKPIESATLTQGDSGLVERIGAWAARTAMVGQSEVELTQKALVAAGFRNKGTLFKVLGLRVCAALLGVLIALSLEPLFEEHGQVVFATACVTAGLLGWRLPMVVVSRMAVRRQWVISQQLPNAIDLLILCGEAGFGIEAGLARVGRELNQVCPPLAQEFSIVLAEMRILSDRNQAFVNLAERLQIDSARSLATTLSQAARYGTPLGRALRVLSREIREEYRMRMETRAGKLPVLITIPMIIFILPCILILVGGPAALDIAQAFPE